MASKKWCIGVAPLREAPDGARLLDVPLGAVIEATGNTRLTTINGRQALWSEIVYRGRQAWIYDGYLEEYIEKYPREEVLIPHPTVEPNDAAQYMLLEGRIKYNMCGELCVAFIGGDDIDTFLAKWAVVSPNYYKWALQGENDNATGLDALESMLKVYGYGFPITRFDAGLTDPIIGFKMSPGRLSRMLETHHLIAGVRIDGYTGKLRGQGVGHWVVLERVEPSGVNGGWVELYNPFPNRRQQYSYDEFINAVSINRAGLWIKRLTPTPSSTGTGQVPSDLEPLSH